MIIEGIGLLAVLYVGCMLIFILFYVALSILVLPLKLMKSHYRKKNAARAQRERAAAAYAAVMARGNVPRAHRPIPARASRTRPYEAQCAAHPWLPRTPIPPAPTASDYARASRLP